MSYLIDATFDRCFGNETYEFQAADAYDIMVYGTELPKTLPLSTILAHPQFSTHMNGHAGYIQTMAPQFVKYNSLVSQFELFNDYMFVNTTDSSITINNYTDVKPVNDLIYLVIAQEVPYKDYDRCLAG